MRYEQTPAFVPEYNETSIKGMFTLTRFSVNREHVIEDVDARRSLILRPTSIYLNTDNQYLKILLVLVQENQHSVSGRWDRYYHASSQNLSASI